MSQIKQLNPRDGITLLAVKITEECAKHHIGINPNGTRLFLWDGKGLCTHLPFPCKLLGISTEIPEEVWQGIMPKGQVRYKDFVGGYLFKKATDAAMSMLAAHEMYSKNPLAGIFRPHSGEPDPANLGEVLVSAIYEDLREEYFKYEANTGTWIILKQI